MVMGVMEVSEAMVAHIIIPTRITTIGINHNSPMRIPEDIITVLEEMVA